MAFELVGINRTVGCDCPDCEGGIEKFFITDFCYISDIPLGANGNITGLPVMTTTGTWADYVHDTDDTANYTQVPELIGTRSKQINHNLFAKFACINESVVQESNRLKKCCNPVIAVEWTNGLKMLIGVDIVEDGAGGYEFKKSKGQTNLMPSIISGTTAEEDRMELTITSRSRCYAGVFDSVVDLDGLLTI